MIEELRYELEDILFDINKKSGLYDKDFIFTYSEYDNKKNPLFDRGIDFKELTYKKASIDFLELASDYIVFEVFFKDCNFLFDADSLLNFYGIDYLDRNRITQKDIVKDIENQIFALQKSDVFATQMECALKDAICGLIPYDVATNFLEIYREYKNEMIKDDRICENVFMQYEVNKINISSTTNAFILFNHKNEALLNGKFSIAIQGAINLDCRYEGL